MLKFLADKVADDFHNLLTFFVAVRQLSEIVLRTT